MKPISYFNILFMLWNYSIHAQVNERFGTFATEWDSEVTSSVITEDGGVVYGGGYGRWGYITLINSAGKVSWEQRIESEYGANCESLVMDEFGQIYALIQFRRAVKIDNIEVDLDSFEDVTMLLKVKPEGNYVLGDYLIMEKLRAQKMVYNQNTGLVLTMLFRHSVNFMDGMEYKGSMNEILVANFSRQFNLKWVKHLQGTGDNTVAAMDIDENGAIYLAGKGLSDISFTGEKQVYTTTGATTSFNYIAKLDHLGNVQWAHILNDGGAVDVSAIQSNSQGQVILGGAYSGRFSYGGAKANSSEQRAPFLIVLDRSGQVALHHLFGTTVHEAWITDLVIDRGRVVVIGSFFRDVVFNNTNLQSDESEDAWRFQRNGFVASWSPFQNQLKVSRYHSDNNIHLTGINTYKQQAVIFGGLAGSLFIDNSKKLTASNRFSGFFHQKHGLSKEDHSISDEIVIIYDDEDDIIELIEQIEMEESTEKPITEEITNVQPVESQNNILIIEKDSELVFAIIDDFGDIVTLGGVHEEFGVISFENNAAQLKEGIKKQPIATINGEIIIVSDHPDRPDDSKEGEKNDEPTTESKPEDGVPTPNKEKFFPPPTLPDDAEDSKVIDPLDYCLSITNSTNWEKYVCLAEKGMDEIYSIRDKYEKIQTELGNAFHQKYGNISLTDLPEHQKAAVEKDLKELMLKSKEVDAAKLAEFDEVREKYTTWLNTLVKTGTIAYVPISGSHFTQGNVRTDHFHWDKYSVFTGPVVVFRVGVENFTREKVGIGLTCRSQGAIELTVYDKLSNQIGPKYTFITRENIQSSGVLKFGLRIVENKKMARIVQTDIQYLNSFKCEQEEIAAEVITPDFVPSHYFNRNRAIRLALMAGIKEFNQVTTEGFSILGKIACAMHMKDKSGLAANKVNLITWAGTNLAEPYFFLFENRSQVFEFLKEKRETIEFTAELGEILHSGFPRRNVMDIYNVELQKKLLEYLVASHPQVLKD